MMDKQRQLFWDTIKAFNDIGILSYVVVIGSWAEHIYELAYFQDFEANLRTRDIDFLYPNIRKPDKKVDLIKSLEELGFLVAVDSLTEITKFYNEELEIEFLVRDMGQGQSDAYEVEALNIKAEGLRHMDILSRHSIAVEIKGFTVKVPYPQAYVLHKLIINKSRKTKKEKDIRSVIFILEKLKEDPHKIEKLKGIYDTLSKKEKQRIDETCKENSIDLFM
ncbi:MAG: hypothetical protein APF77_03980 [Clostridia bacterium BRH_c25]|nr:MAG: hypothetical protein APF77_03980 [Clostridia bacterium BRH_c25]